MHAGIQVRFGNDEYDDHDAGDATVYAQGRSVWWMRAPLTAPVQGSADARLDAGAGPKKQ